MEEEIHRDYECFPELDDNDVRRGIIKSERNEIAGMTQSLAIAEADEDDDDEIEIADSKKSSRTLKTRVANSTDSPRTAYSKATT